MVNEKRKSNLPYKIRLQTEKNLLKFAEEKHEKKSCFGLEKYRF